MTEAADIHNWDGPTMDVAIKIWRVDEDGDRDLVSYELEAPEWACLLDVLDLIKDRHDGTLAYRKSCRMMICGSCGMRMRARSSCPTAAGRSVSHTFGGHTPRASIRGQAACFTSRRAWGRRSSRSASSRGPRRPSSF